MKKEVIVNALKKVLDPELGISLVDLGLIYDVKISQSGKVTVVMTLTTVGCPLFDYMAENIKQEIGKIKGINEVEVELTFEPAWTIESMSRKARKQIGFE